MSTLFEQIGGPKAMDAAVDLFYRKVLADDRISHFFDDVDMDRQIAKQKSFGPLLFLRSTIYPFLFCRYS